MRHQISTFKHVLGTLVLLSGSSVIAGAPANCEKLLQQNFEKLCSDQFSKIRNTSSTDSEVRKSVEILNDQLISIVNLCAQEISGDYKNNLTPLQAKNAVIKALETEIKSKIQSGGTITTAQTELLGYWLPVSYNLSWVKQFHWQLPASCVARLASQGELSLSAQGALQVKRNQIANDLMQNLETQSGSVNTELKKTQRLHDLAYKKYEEFYNIDSNTIADSGFLKPSNVAADDEGDDGKKVDDGKNEGETTVKHESSSQAPQVATGNNSGTFNPSPTAPPTDKKKKFTMPAGASKAGAIAAGTIGAIAAGVGAFIGASPTRSKFQMPTSTTGTGGVAPGAMDLGAAPAAASGSGGTNSVGAEEAVPLYSSSAKSLAGRGVSGVGSPVANSATAATVTNSANSNKLQSTQKASGSALASVPNSASTSTVGGTRSLVTAPSKKKEVFLDELPSNNAEAQSNH